ncbi:MAG: hypothetical protein LBR81_02490 [Prevotellaceae bacterium]|jgi:hypothetical protein|nr:hypothetical protein [Prevotellaceae bacterium]
MNIYFFILLLILTSVSCTIQQRDNKIVGSPNFSVQNTIIIDTDCSFLTDDEFNRAILDTTKMYKLNRNTSLQIQQAINRSFYEFETKTRGKSDYVLAADTTLFGSYFCMGKLDLQSSVNSLIIWNYYGISPLSERELGALWLLNIKDNKLCSAIHFLFFFSINDSIYPNICVNNGVFTYNAKELGAPDLINTSIYGKIEDFKSKYIKQFSTFKVNENGFVEFTKDKPMCR